MKKFLANGLALFAGVVSTPLAKTPPCTTPQPPVMDYREDPRFETLKNFFGKADCPAAEYAHVFLEAADDYDLDWRLLPSISFLESTGGKSATNNNLFGWDEGRAEFTSPSAGIHSVAYQLTHSPLYRQKSLDEKLARYNPNAAYAQKVKSMMRRIAPEE